MSKIKILQNKRRFKGFTLRLPIHHHGDCKGNTKDRLRYLKYKDAIERFYI